MKNRLSTSDRIIKWNPNIDTTCVLCKQNIETKNHLFFSCSYSNQIWGKLMKELLRTQYTEERDDIIALLLDRQYNQVKLFLMRYAFQVTVHTIWRERNRMRHGEKHLPYTLTLKTIDKTIRNGLSTIKRHGDHRMEEGLDIVVWYKISLVK